MNRVYQILVEVESAVQERFFDNNSGSTQGLILGAPNLNAWFVSTITGKEMSLSEKIGHDIIINYWYRIY